MREIAFLWSPFAYPWYWRPRVSRDNRGIAVRWGYAYTFIGRYNATLTTS